MAWQSEGGRAMEGRAATDTELQALEARVEAAFLYGVTTTGVFCRCGCPSRLARPENISIFEDVVQARAAGFRPCRRCRPA